MPANIPFRAALDFLRDKVLMPTAASSAQLRDIPAQIRQRSMLSARTTNATYLQEVKNMTESLLQGQFNEATARAKLQDMLDSLGYNPARHFGADADAGIPPAESGSLRDLSSDRRIKLILDTQERQAANFGYMLQGQTDLARWQFPCWELIRIYTRRTERTGVKSWPQRWHQLGGQFHGGGRMIAPKDDPIWDALGSSGNFDDALDTPYPPFAYNSGMGWRAVQREECVALGVIPDTFMPAVQDSDFLSDLRAQAVKFDPEFLSALRDDLSSDSPISNLKSQISNFLQYLSNYSPSQPRDSLGRWVDEHGGGLSERHNIARGLRAMRRAILKKKDVQKAMFRKGIGQIDFEWGTPGIKAQKREKGGGISHIRIKHQRDLYKIPEAIAWGKIGAHPNEPDKRLIRYKKMLVIIKKKNSRSSWLVTGFEDEK